MEPILLIDTNYLCHRAFHAIGDLTYEDAGVGAIFGVLRDIVTLQNTFNTGRCVFAFDPGGRGLRHGLLPTYKSSRRLRHKDETNDERLARADFQRQVHLLRDNYLPSAGFRNVFVAPGFEADDIIASLVRCMPPNQEAIIISNDQDLWQCIRPNVWCWNPHKKKGYDLDAFRSEWGIEPCQWADVKALAGCKTDDVPGVPGVGEKTAVKWLRGEIKAHTKTAQKLRRAGEIYEQSIQLVRLPFPNTPEFEIQPDEVTEEKWQALADRLGMRSIRNTIPRTATKKSKGRKRDNKKGFGFK